MRHPLFAICFAALVLFQSSGTHAQSADNRAGAYVYGGLGAANTQWEAKRSTVPPGQKRDENTSSTSFVLGGGYRFNRNFALEGSYHDMLGDVSRRGIGSFDARSLQLSALAIWPIGDRFELFSKVSLGHTHNEFDPDRGRAGLRKATENVNFLGVGIGANYHFNDRFSLRLDIDGLSKAGDQLRARAGADDINTNEATLSLAYRF